MRNLFLDRYPKLIWLIAAIAMSYAIFSNPSIQDYITSLNSLSYLGIFIAGTAFTFGFTSPFAAGFFITANPQNIWLAGLIGGLDAMAGDMLIFSFIRFSFMDEFRRLKKTAAAKKIKNLIEKNIGHKIKIYIMYAFAGIIIASPLPDEVGVTMLAGLSSIKARTLATASYILNTIGIFIILNL